MEIGRHLLGDDGGQGTLAHAWRSDQQGVVKLLVVHLGRIQCDPTWSITPLCPIRCESELGATSLISAASLFSMFSPLVRYSTSFMLRISGPDSPARYGVDNSVEKVSVAAQSVQVPYVATAWHHLSSRAESPGE